MKVRNYRYTVHFQFYACLQKPIIYYIMFIVHISIEYKRPELRDVYRYVVPEYAHKWRYLGALLNFKQAELDIIFSNFRNDAEECCRSLLSRWLEKNPVASWNVLLSAINDLPPLPEFGYQGMDEV